MRVRKGYHTVLYQAEKLRQSVVAIDNVHHTKYIYVSFPHVLSNKESRGIKCTSNFTDDSFSKPFRYLRQLQHRVYVRI